MINVAVQLEQLQRHHSLQQGLRSGELHLTGLFYDIATAQVLQVTTAGISHLVPVPRTIENTGHIDNTDKTGNTVAAGPGADIGAA